MEHYFWLILQILGMLRRRSAQVLITLLFKFLHQLRAHRAPQSFRSFLKILFQIIPGLGIPA
jgi:hypothetical protein